MSCKQKRMVPGVVYLQYRMRKSGGCAEEVWAGEAPEGPTFPRRLCRAGRGQLRGRCKCPKEFFRRPAMDSRPSANLKTYRPPKEIPRCGPPGRLHLQYSTRKSGACAGEGLAGGGLEGGLSGGGQPLQGLLPWWEPYQAGPSKVFSNGSNLHKRGSEGPGEKILQGFAGNPANSG